jgi:two-component system, LytTR family, response regulator
MGLRALVVDDEPNARADLVRTLEELGVVVVCEAADAKGALVALEREKPQVMFLDIELPGMDGLALAARPELPPIVFVTAHAEHASSAFDLDACDYVRKPVTRERLERAISRLERRVTWADPESSRLRVTTSKGTRLIEAGRVPVFSAGDKYVHFVVDGEEHLLRASLDELEIRLGPEGFLRTHRAHLVQTRSIERWEDGARGLVLSLKDGSTVPVSKRMRSRVLAALR